MIIREKKDPKTILQILNDIPHNAFFGVSFIKRSTGELRKMGYHKGVKKHTKGGSLRYKPNDKGLVGVWENKSHKGKDSGYRMISIEGVTEIVFGGNTWIFE